MSDYPPIEGHALIGDLQTAALVSTDGEIDWFCLPRFDSPSIFASILDRERGGHFRIGVSGEGVVTRQMYLPGTAIVMTRFMSTDGVGEVIDFMPPAGYEATDRHTLVRLVRVVRGRIRFEAECAPRFDYAREVPQVEMSEGGVRFTGAHQTFNLNLAPEKALGKPVEVEQSDGGFRASIELDAGDVGALVLESQQDGPPRRYTRDEVVGLFEKTRDFWRDWVAHSTYRGRWREAVERSAMTLKMMTYAPTGALVAAPTASLPEQIGGERNWDYRYTWVRDASFSIYALLSLGFTDEAQAFVRWLNDRVGESHNGKAPLQIMYRIDGTPDMTEEILDHLEGYRGSSPVHIGNGAMDQLQLDIFGEALDSVYLAESRNLAVSYEGWLKLKSLIDWVADNWDQPEEGIWETRGGQRPFVYGRLMSWVALDRAVRLAEKLGRPANLDHWIAERDRVYTQIMEKGWSEDRQAFVQHYDTSVLDASLLYMPLVGFVAPGDPRWASTLRAMDHELVSDSLVYRYNPEASPDGLRGSEGTFSMCTFWYVDALARSGRLEEARLTFDKMMTYGNHVGLFSEEIGPTGEQLGNFPQAFTHLALIASAVNLDYQLDHGPGWVKPVVAPGVN